MIDPKELRLENLLWLPGINRFVKVSAIFKTHFRCQDFDGISFDESIRVNYQPVELTPEILEAAGFKYNEFTENYDIFYDAVGMVGINKYDGSFVIANDNEDMGFTGDLKSACKYLHQLQNLIYALTGQELQIDVNKLNK